MKHKKQILMVARPSEWQIFTGQALRAAGYTIHLADDIASALREIAVYHFDLIIVDAGFVDLLKALIREQGAYRLLVVTATPSVRESLLAYRYGAMDYVSKIFDASKLLATVAEALQKSPVQEPILA